MAILFVPLLAGPASWSAWVGRIWSRAVFFGLRAIAGLGYEVRGRMPPPGRLIAIKHMSMWDTMAIHTLLGDPAIVLKRQLLFVPFYGWYLYRAGMIPIDRDGGAQALRRMTRWRGSVSPRPQHRDLSRRHAQEGARAAGLQARRRRALRPARRALRAGGAELRPVLDRTGRVPEKARPDRRRIPRAHSARPAAPRPSCSCSSHGSRQQRQRSSPKERHYLAGTILPDHARSAWWPLSAQAPAN